MFIQLAEIISKTAAYGILILSVAVTEESSRPEFYSLEKSWKDITFVDISCTNKPFELIPKVLCYLMADPIQ